MIRIKAIRDSARGQECTIQAPCCNHNVETTVLAHFHEDGHGTMGGKSDDSSAAYTCSDCHDWLDGRVRHEYLDGISKDYYWVRGITRTHRLIIENEILTTGKTGSYRQGVADRTEEILNILRPCLARDATLQKLVKAIEELD